MELMAYSPQWGFDFWPFVLKSLYTSDLVALEILTVADGVNVVSATLR